MSIAFPIKIDVFQLLVTMSEALNLVSPQLMNHHRQVAHIAVSIGEELDLEHGEIVDLALAGAVHDIGGISLCSRLDVLDFEVTRPELHTLPGYYLIRTFKPFARLAEMIRYHHQYWLEGEGDHCEGRPVPRESHILHLADRISILVDKRKEILSQAGGIVNRIVEKSGHMFEPEHVEAFRKVADREAFWLDLISPAVCQYMEQKYNLGTMTLDAGDLREFTTMLSGIIDFRSRFTATHSSGVAIVAETLAAKYSLSEGECFSVKIAGYLHDIGKLVVPTEVLEKKKKLTPADFDLIRKHPYYSYRILQSLQQMEEIADWCACHHERLDGGGYPFHIKNEGLPQGARVLGVADTFTALAEVRPYREALSGRGTFRILEQMAKAGKIDSDLVALLHNDYEEINQLRFDVQQTAYEKHKRFMASIESSC